MYGVEEVMGELKHGLPPGFRFHPTDEELMAFYLASKVFQHGTYSPLKIAEVDLNRCEPWELPDGAKMGEKEWYFFSLRMRKYPTGLRTNRATAAGYWKATGKDRQIYSTSNGAKLGTRKTLVFYKGGAPRGHKTTWVLHEYRLHPRPNSCNDEWVLCRIIQKAGEKTKPRPSVQEQQRLFEAATLSPSPISLPPTPPTLLESETTVHHFYLHENDLTMNPQSDLVPVGFQTTSFPSAIITASNISPPTHLSPSCSTLLIDSFYSYRPFFQDEGPNFFQLEAAPPVDSTTEAHANWFRYQKTSTFAFEGETPWYSFDDFKSSSIAGEVIGCQILY